MASRKSKSPTKNQIEMKRLKEQSKIAKKAIDSKNLADKRAYQTAKRQHKVDLAKAKSKAANIRATGLAIAEATAPLATSATLSIDAATKNKQPIINNTYQTTKLIDPTNVTTEGDNDEVNDYFSTIR